MSEVGWTSLPLPDGFLPNLSFITWTGVAQINNGHGAADGTYRKQTLLGGKIRTVIMPHPKGGVISIAIQMKYKLVIPPSRMPPIPKLLEQDEFLFGCKWEYSFAQGRLSFGPGEKIAYPKIRGHRYLQGSCEDLQNKDQGAGLMPWVYARPQLELKSMPGVSDGWSYQLPVVGGPSYTPEGSSPTPDGDFSLGDFRIDLDVRAAPRAPEPPINLDPKLLQVMLTFEGEGQRDITNTRFGELKKWVNAIQISNLYPVIQNGYLPLHIRGHASPTGTELRDQKLSTIRRQNVQNLLVPMLNGTPTVVPWDQGSDAAQAIKPEPKDPNKAYLMYRNVTIYIEPAEAITALRRYNSAKEKEQDQ